MIGWSNTMTDDDTLSAEHADFKAEYDFKADYDYIAHNWGIAAADKWLKCVDTQTPS